MRMPNETKEFTTYFTGILSSKNSPSNKRRNLH